MSAAVVTRATPTPGPWKANAEIDRRASAVWNEQTHTAICIVGNDQWPQRCPDRDTMSANAHLIAAAPDLLAACELADRHLCSLAPMPAGESDGHFGDRRAVTAIRAAIAKARGGVS